MPHDLATAAILFAALAAVVVPLQFGDRVLSTSTDMIMLGRLQERLHDRLSILGSNFHQRVGLSDATMIVTRYAMTMQSLMREVASFPFVRGLTLLTAMIYLLNSLSMLGNPPAWVSVMLVGIVVLFPIVGWGLSNFLRSAFQRSTLAEMAVAKEFDNSDVLPLEIQAMGANEQRAKVFRSADRRRGEGQSARRHAQRSRLSIRECRARFHSGWAADLRRVPDLELWTISTIARSPAPRSSVSSSSSRR